MIYIYVENKDDVQVGNRPILIYLLLLEEVERIFVTDQVDSTI